MRRALVPLLVATMVGEPRTVAIASTQAGAVNALAAGLKEFQERLNAYLKLREEMTRRLKPLSSTPSAAELATRQDALAAAIRAARKGARPGDLVAPAAALIAKVCMEDFHFRNPDIKRAALEEVPSAPRPVINQTFPEDAALATVPPLLLAKLPPLPDNLQYRFFGRHIAILDADTQIIVDYVANVLPAH
jgi:hypothetical protein